MVIVGEPALNVLESARTKEVWLSVALNVAERNKDVSGNWTGSVGLNDPGPILPSGITNGDTPSFTVREAFRKVRLVKTGKSGGRAKPPDPGSPVKFEMLKTFTPGPGPAGMRTSNEMKPTYIVVANESWGRRKPNRSEDSSGKRNMTDASLLLPKSLKVILSRLFPELN